MEIAGGPISLENPHTGRLFIPRVEMPVATIAPETAAPAAETITITRADLEAQIEAAVQARLAERPSRADILRKQREAREAAWKKTKEAVAAVRDEVALVMDPDGREYVKEDLRAVGDAAMERAIEIKNAAVKKGVEAWRWTAGKGVEVLQTAEAGAKDLVEFSAAKISEPMIKAKVGNDRFFDGLVVGARLRMEDLKIGVQEKIEGAGNFAGRVARVAEGVNRALESEGFSAVEVMGDAADRLGKEARKRAEAAAAKAAAYRDVKIEILAVDKLSEFTAYGERVRAEKRTAVAGRFPNFVSKFSKLFGKG